MRVKVAKWGNSLGVRLPKSAADVIGATAGSEIDLTIVNGELRLRGRVKTSAELLDEMIAEMKRLGPEAIPPMVDWGPDRGSEIIDDAYSRGEMTSEGDPMPLADLKPPSTARSGQKHAAQKRR